MSTGLRDALQKPLKQRITIRVPSRHARQLNDYRNKSRVVRDATHQYLDRHADPETTLHPPDDNLLTHSAEWDRVTTRVTEELLDDVDGVAGSWAAEAGRAPNRSAVIRRAIARYLGGEDGDG
jgi:metal-responsive CopG/Arc/MetJ family transcriptional regulator